MQVTLKSCDPPSNPCLMNQTRGMQATMVALMRDTTYRRSVQYSANTIASHQHTASEDLVDEHKEKGLRGQDGEDTHFRKVGAHGRGISADRCPWRHCNFTLCIHCKALFAEAWQHKTLRRATWSTHALDLYRRRLRIVSYFCSVWYHCGIRAASGVRVALAS